MYILSGDVFWPTKTCEPFMPYKVNKDNNNMKRNIRKNVDNTPLLMLHIVHSRDIWTWHTILHQTVS